MWAFQFFTTSMRVTFTKLQEDLTPATTKKVLDGFKKGQKPKPGPQGGRHTSENSAGLTALTSKASLPLFLRSCGFILISKQPYGPGEHCSPEFS